MLEGMTDQQLLKRWFDGTSDALRWIQRVMRRLLRGLKLEHSTGVPISREDIFAHGNYNAASAFGPKASRAPETIAAWIEIENSVPRNIA